MNSKFSPSPSRRARHIRHKCAALSGFKAAGTASGESDSANDLDKPDIEIYSSVNSDKGGRPYQEDQAVQIDDFNVIIPKARHRNLDITTRRAFYAVFDGHGGGKCSKFLAENFHTMLANHEMLGDKPDEALKQVWQRVEESFLDLCSQKYSKAKKKGETAAFHKSGSTAAVVFIVGNIVYVANCGDSHVYLYNKPLGTDSHERLTDDHNTSNPSECERIVESGGSIAKETRTRKWMCFIKKPTQTGKLRVYPGGLAITRSFGDFHAKLRHVGGIPDSVIPDFEQLRALPIDDDWKGICIASDGVWDALAPDEAWSTFEAAKNASMARSVPERIACGVNATIDACLESIYWSHHHQKADNTTAIVLLFGNQEPGLPDCDENSQLDVSTVPMPITDDNDASFEQIQKQIEVQVSRQMCRHDSWDTGEGGDVTGQDTNRRRNLKKMVTFSDVDEYEPDQSTRMLQSPGGSYRSAFPSLPHITRSAMSKKVHAM